MAALTKDGKSSSRHPDARRSFAASLRGRVSDAMERLLDIRWIWSLVFLVSIAPLMVGPSPAPVLPEPAIGTVVSGDVIAPQTLEFVDDAATRDVKEAAREAVLPIYVMDSRALVEAVATVRRLFEAGRHGGGVDLGAPQRTIAHLTKSRFEAATEERLVFVLGQVFRHHIVGSRASLGREGRVVVRDSLTGRETRQDHLEGVLTLDEARALALKTLRAQGAEPGEVEALGPFLTDLVTPNLAFDSILSEARRQEAAARIEPLLVRIPKGKVLLRAGELVTQEAAHTLRELNRASQGATPRKVLLANMLFMGLLLFFMSRYVFLYQKSYKKDRHLFAVMVVTTVVGLHIDAGFAWLYGHVADTLKVEPYANPEFYRAMMPVAVGAMLITLLANARVGMAYVLFYVPLFGMMMAWDVPLVLFCLISNLAAIYGITTYHQRTALIKAGILLGGINAAVVLAILSASGRVAPASVIFFQMFCGFAGGILVAVLVSFLLPLLEALFNILTDIRLLELSNLNNPLLRRLAVEAPGSYNHSVIVGTLAEAAAEAIGANALFCRVAAYYHDVGKMLKPDYFIENQRGATNRHDTLSPHMSALVIASHVKEGYELAKSYGLPKQVLDIIPQHHGTRKINFFYQKAKRGEGTEPGGVMESDYRYPGPKPQTREAAIFMLSDSIEAAARTLEDPSPSRFKGLIRRIISDVILDDQFDQCDLTFADLENVSSAFLRTLSSIYHHRIDYPGFDFDKVPERPFQGSRTHEDLPQHQKGWRR